MEQSLRTHDSDVSQEVEHGPHDNVGRDDGNEQSISDVDLLASIQELSKELTSSDADPDRPHIDRVIELLSAILTKTSNAPNLQSTCLCELSRAHLARYRHFQVQGDLAWSLELAKQALAVLPEDDPDRVEALFTLSRCRRARYSYFGQKKDLREMLSLSSDIVALCPPNHPRHIAALENCVADFYATFDRTKDVSHLDAAITVQRQILQLHTAGSSDRSSALFNLSRSLIDRGRLRKDRGDFDEAIELRSEKLELHAEFSPLRASRIGELASALTMRYIAFHDPNDLDKAVSLQEERYTYSPVHDPLHAQYLNDLVKVLDIRVNASPTLPAVEHLLALLRQLLAITPQDNARRSTILSSLAGALELRMSLSGVSDEDLEDCVVARRQAVELCPVNHGEYTERLSRLAASLELKAKTRADDPSLIQEIIEIRQKALRYASKDDFDYVDLLISLGESLEMRYKHSHSREDLDNAISYYEQAERLDNLDEEDHLRILVTLGNVIFCQLSADDSVDLTAWARLISMREEALRACPPDAPHYSTLCEYLAIALKRAHIISWQPQYLERSIPLFREAVEKTPSDDSDKPLLMLNLSKALMTLHLVTNDSAPIEEALQWNRQALELLAVDHPQRVECQCSLAEILQRRYLYHGDARDIEEALETIGRAFTDAKSVEDKVLCLDAQAVAYRARYNVHQDVEELDKAVQVHERALTLIFSPGVLWRDVAQGLVKDLRDRFDETTDPADILRAIQVQKEVLQSYADSDTGRSAPAHLLIELLLNAHSRMAEPTYLEEALRICPEVSATDRGGGVGRMQLLASYGKALRIRYNQIRDPRDAQELAVVEKELMDFQTGGKLDFSLTMLQMTTSWWTKDRSQDAGEVVAGRRQLLSGAVNQVNLIIAQLQESRDRFQESGDLKDLDEAIRICTDALTNLLPENSRYRASLGSEVARLYQERHKDSGSSDDLDLAIQWARDALGHTSSQSTTQENRMLQLAELLLARYGSDQSEQVQLVAACKLLEDVSNSVRCEIHIRFHSAMTWAFGAANNGLTESALQAFRTLFSLLPKLAWLGSDTRASLHAISAARYLPVEAATFALKHSSVEEAIEFLDAGRAVIWTQATRLRRPVDNVEAVSPELASRLKDIAGQLQSRQGSETQASDYKSADSKLRHEWFVVVDEIRRLPGLEHFLQYSPYASLSEVSREGPVVILLDHEKCCTAIIMSSPDAAPAWIALTMTVKKLQTLHDRLRLVANSRGGLSGHDISGLDKDCAPATRAGRAGAPKSSPDNDLLTILWNEVAQPIIQHLTDLAVPKLQERRRLWWCCVGHFSFMPIHAAGKYKGRGAVSVSDFFISSYTPTLATLLEARVRQDPTDHKVLAVVQPDPGHGFDPLPNTRKELQEVFDVVPPNQLLSLDGSGRMDLEGISATPENVMSKLPEVSVLHLACHGVQETLNPLRSGFILRDGLRLTVQDLMKQPLPHASIAFLSACYTASSDVERPDEAINLANGMLFSGFPSVLATMWPMGDAEGPMVTRSMYKRLFRDSGGRPSSRSVASALDATVRELRKTLPWERWAVFIHLGV